MGKIISYLSEENRFRMHLCLSVEEINKNIWVSVKEQALNEIKQRIHVIIYTKLQNRGFVLTKK